MEPRLKWTR